MHATWSYPPGTLWLSALLLTRWGWGELGTGNTFPDHPWWAKDDHTWLHMICMHILDSYDMSQRGKDARADVMSEFQACNAATKPYKGTNGLTCSIPSIICNWHSKSGFNIRLGHRNLDLDIETWIRASNSWYGHWNLNLAMKSYIWISKSWFEHRNLNNNIMESGIEDGKRYLATWA